MLDRADTHKSMMYNMRVFDLRFSDLKGLFKAALAKARPVFLFCAAKLSMGAARLQSSRIALRAALSVFSLAVVFSAMHFFWRQPEALSPAASPFRRTAQSPPASRAGAFALESEWGCEKLPQAFEAYHELAALSRLVSARALSQAAGFLKKAQSGGLEAKELDKMIRQLDEAEFAARDNEDALRERFKKAESCASSFSEGGEACANLSQELAAYYDLALQPAKGLGKLLSLAQAALQSLQRGGQAELESLIGQMDEARYAIQDGEDDLWDQLDTIMECLDPLD